MMGTLLPPLSATPLPCGHGFMGQMSPRGHQAELGWWEQMKSPRVPRGRKKRRSVLQTCLRRATVCVRLRSKRPLSPSSSIFFQVVLLESAQRRSNDI